jgi:hypothetical protein
LRFCSIVVVSVVVVEVVVVEVVVEVVVFKDSMAFLVCTQVL